jgi:hypothetical protein
MNNNRASCIRDEGEGSRSCDDECVRLWAVIVN